MTELRLIDGNGYTVEIVTASAGVVDDVRDHLLTDVAPKHAAQWAALGFKADPRDYRVQLAS